VQRTQNHALYWISDFSRKSEVNHALPDETGSDEISNRRTRHEKIMSQDIRQRKWKEWIVRCAAAIRYRWTRFRVMV